MLSIGLITNEIFRRVEPNGRTMAEFLKDEFPELDLYSGIEDSRILDRIHNMRVVPSGLEDIFHLKAEKLKVPPTETLPNTPERLQRLNDGFTIKDIEIRPEYFLGMFNSEQFRRA